MDRKQLINALKVAFDRMNNRIGPSCYYDDNGFDADTQPRIGYDGPVDLSLMADDLLAELGRPVVCNRCGEPVDPDCGTAVCVRCGEEQCVENCMQGELCCVCNLRIQLL
jgi:hypothetical protein